MESTAKQLLPLVPAPAGGAADVTDSADARSVNWPSHARNSRCTPGSYALGIRFPGPATRTQLGVIGLATEGSEHWWTPSALETTETSVVPPTAPPPMSARQ